MVRLLGKYLGDRWLAEHKAELNKEFEAYRDKLEQKRRRLEVELGQRVYITQTQFDTEFNALKSIFASLGKLRLAFNSIAPEVGIHIEDKEERFKDLAARLETFVDRTNGLTDTAEGVYPFVPENIYEQVYQCMKRAQIEILHLRTAGPKTFDLEWYEDRAKQRDQFNEHYFRAVTLTREHFRSLTILRQESGSSLT